MSNKQTKDMQAKDMQTTAKQAKAWWNYGYAWLVFGGPATVVIASLITVYIAVSHRDPLVDEDYYRKGLEINKTLLEAKTTEERNALEPAMLARNHAATGVNK
ncbi:MAG: FixH family protein [Methylotenera sp.]